MEYNFHGLLTCVDRMPMPTPIRLGGAYARGRLY